MLKANRSKISLLLLASLAIVIAHPNPVQDGKLDLKEKNTKRAVVFFPKWFRNLNFSFPEAGRFKRSSVDFMGMRVSYPQYLRLKNLQKEVIKMDQMIRHMVKVHDINQLASNPYWIELLELYDAMKKMLPPEYLETVGYEDPIPI